MAYEEDYEAVIIQKLGDMKDFLESFMSNLEEPDQEKGGRTTYVKAPVSGTIRWKVGNGKVNVRDPLCYIREDNGDVELVRAPAGGYLRILVRSGWRATRIAKIKEEVYV